MHVEEKIHELDQISGYIYLKKFFVEAYAKEMQSSWAIEGEILDSYAIRSQLVRQLALNIPEWIAEESIVQDDRENRGVQAALLLLNTKENLSSDLLKKIHGLLEDNEYFGKLRTSAEVVCRNSSIY